VVGDILSKYSDIIERRNRQNNRIDNNENIDNKEMDTKIEKAVDEQ